MPPVKLRVIINFIIENYFECHQDKLSNARLFVVRGIFSLYFDEYFQMSKHQSFVLYSFDFIITLFIMLFDY